VLTRPRAPAAPPRAPLPRRAPAQECKGAYYCSAACAEGAGRQRHRAVCGWEAPVLSSLRAAAATALEPHPLEPYEETTVRLVLAVVMAHAEAETEGAAERCTERGAPTYRDVLAQVASDAATPPRTAALAALAHAAFAKARAPHTATHARAQRAPTRAHARQVGPPHARARTELEHASSRPRNPDSRTRNSSHFSRLRLRSPSPPPARPSSRCSLPA
jgi:hypothetical protein